jgi:PKD repeat protein
MRSIGLVALVTGTLVLAPACGSDGGTPPSENAAPVANFPVPACVINVPCDFASTSTDDAGVTAWSWDFDGDGTPDATTATASFTYATAGTFTVSLTVEDAQGLSNTKTGSVTIAPPNPANTPPTAAFSFSCAAGDCTFTSTSTDATPGTVAAWAWDFGDGATGTGAAPTHSYTPVADSTDFTVSLIATDNDGASDTTSQTIRIGPPPNVAPTAAFTFSCNTVSVCSFTSTSTDPAPGTITTFAWQFGDGGASALANPTHGYSVTVTTDFDVTLTVTDNDGATNSVTQTVTVSPPPPGAEGCTTSGTQVNCFLNVTDTSNIRVVITGLSCDLSGQRVTAPPPSGDQMFLDICNTHAVGDSTKIFGGPGDIAFIYPAGSQARIKFTQGSPGAGDPPLAAPAATLTGTFPTWTISFEDGSHPNDPGEPDFADIVLRVEATLPARN